MCRPQGVVVVGGLDSAVEVESVAGTLVEWLPPQGTPRGALRIMVRCGL